MKFSLKFWNWVLNRSPQNAAKPNVQLNPVQDNNATIPLGTEPFETFIMRDRIIGLQTEFGSIETSLRTSAGQIIRTKDNLSVLIGCGHIIKTRESTDQQNKDDLQAIGQCFVCQEELFKQAEKGEITVFQAEINSLVCNKCAKITVSGQLCCPKHYTAVSNPDGTKIYLSPEDAEEQKRQNTTKTILTSVALLFGQNGQEIPQEKRQEQNHD